MNALEPISEATREQAFQALQQLFGEGAIDVATLEHRSEAVACATTRRELQDAMAGLPGTLLRGSVVSGQTLTRVQPVTGDSRIYVFGSSIRRTGPFRIPHAWDLVVHAGSAVLDLSEASLEAPSVLRVRVILGQVRLLVPEEFEVQCEGGGLLGVTPHRTLGTASDRASLRIVCHVTLGRVQLELLKRRSFSSKVGGVVSSWFRRFR